MRTDQYRTEQFADDADRAAYMRMIEHEAREYHNARESHRQIEQQILDRHSDNPAWAEVVGQINDHRANGNYTTNHR